MRIWVLSICLLLSGLRPPATGAEETPAAILEHSRSVYGALTSYSDTGTAFKEYGPSSHDESHFKTAFTRAPRHFLFEYHKPSGDHIVIWGDPDAFHVWWKATGQVTEYPNPKNSGAITLNDYPTDGVITKITPMLYPKGNLPGSLMHFEPERFAGTEEVGGSKCYKLEGTSSDTYGDTGKKVNVHKLVVWIDTSTFLVRKIFEQSPSAPGTLNQITTTFDPKANPQLGSDTFKFEPPK
jgi:outer membrane lipoprotein-sorting protein